jgi:hypothetical protein
VARVFQLEFAFAVGKGRDQHVDVGWFWFDAAVWNGVVAVGVSVSGIEPQHERAYAQPNLLPALVGMRARRNQMIQAPELDPLAEKQKSRCG